jgi:5-methyltetrahydropteroyltriglutamate--homocysteine methyltransferase
VRAYAPGIYPRSERLIRATRDLDRGRANPESVEAAFVVDLGAFVNAQRAAGLDLLADGMLTWQDHFRPLLEAAEGLDVGPLTRFLDTNAFYRAPKATSAAPVLREPVEARYLRPLDGPRVVTLPSPFALSAGTGVTPAAIARGVLKPQLDELDVDLVVLVEPFLARVEEPDLEPLAEALGLLAGGPPLALQFPFGNVRALLERGLEDLPVDGVGIDFYATHDGDVPLGFRKLLLAGVVDARSSALEAPEAISAFVDRLDARGVLDVDLVPNGDLQFVPEPIAREKLARLGRAKGLHR